NILLTIKTLQTKQLIFGKSQDFIVNLQKINHLISRYSNQSIETRISGYTSILFPCKCSKLAGHE
ncbi:MAG: hypothetical protein ACYC25_07840, partial [Paludibacter sp.]